MFIAFPLSENLGLYIGAIPAKCAKDLKRYFIFTYTSMRAPIGADLDLAYDLGYVIWGLAILRGNNYFKQSTQIDVLCFWDDGWPTCVAVFNWRCDLQNTREI